MVIYMEEKEEVQFSIFKIDVEKVGESIILEESDTALDIKEKIIDYLLNKSIKDEVKHTKYDDFDLLLIKSIRFPAWKNLISEMAENGEDRLVSDIEIQNESVSYILFYVGKNNIYVMTGGRGANYVARFIKTNFGLYLIPKIVNKSMPIIKKVHENNITGNALSTERIIKNFTSIAMESGLGNIYRDLDIQIPKEIAQEYGIEIDEKRNSFMVESGNALSIKKSLSLEELKKVLKKIEKLEKVKDNFILNYFVPIDKKNIKVNEVRNIMYEYLIEGKYNDFEILSDNINDYYFNSTRYIIRDEYGNIVLDNETPYKLKDIIILAKNKKGELVKTNIEKVLLKYTIETMDESGENIIHPIRIMDLLRGCIQEDDRCFYLLNGIWYIFEEQFFDSIDEAYYELYDGNIEYAEEIENKFHLKKEIDSEDTYNDSFVNNNEIIVGHKTIIKNIEIADLIFFDEEKLYLMCNKDIFNGSGARDLENQIQTSSMMLASTLINNRKILTEYYEKLKESEKAKINKQEFIKLFNKKIVYIAGFKNNFKRNSRSPYAKHLICELRKLLKSRNQDLIVVNYSN